MRPCYVPDERSGQVRTGGRDAPASTEAEGDGDCLWRGHRAKMRPALPHSHRRHRVVDRLSACGCDFCVGGRVDIRGRLKVKMGVVCRAHRILGLMVREGRMGVLIVVGGALTEEESGPA